ncbi:MAG: hypothetical protein HY815_19105 [Candidatus Riflebacteria bacterium]|nr:hypothetical protein [Candidatus Riflebacteria bacterium]
MFSQNSGVVFVEVEEAAANGGLLFPVEHGRWALLGTTDSGRLLRIILGPTRQGVWWVVTAMPMVAAGDRRIWRRHKG